MAIPQFKQLPCFSHVDWTPSRKVLREFAIAMGVGFLLIGVVVAWRHQHLGTATFLLWSIGLGLAVGSQVPGLGRMVYLAVHVPTSILGFFISRIILVVLFFGVFTPIALLLRLTGKDLLRLRRPNGASHWGTRGGPPSPDSYYRQF